MVDGLGIEPSVPRRAPDLQSGTAPLRSSIHAPAPNGRGPRKLVRVGEFEAPAWPVGGARSIRLSYTRVGKNRGGRLHSRLPRTMHPMRTTAFVVALLLASPAEATGLYLRDACSLHQTRPLDLGFFAGYCIGATTAVKDLMVAERRLCPPHGDHIKPEWATAAVTAYLQDPARTKQDLSKPTGEVVRDALISVFPCGTPAKTP